MEGVLSIATVAQRWRLTYADSAPPEIQEKITLRPKGAVMMRADAR
jgi:cytochrome P450